MARKNRPGRKVHRRGTPEAGKSPNAGPDKRTKKKDRLQVKGEPGPRTLGQVEKYLAEKNRGGGLWGVGD